MTPTTKLALIGAAHVEIAELQAAHLAKAIDMVLAACRPADPVPESDELDEGPELSDDHFRCLEKHCQHRGEAVKRYCTDWVPYGDRSVPMETFELECERCGSNNVVEIEAE